jgi:hypothetical protein
MSTRLPLVERLEDDRWFTKHLEMVNWTVPREVQEALKSRIRKAGEQPAPPNSRVAEFLSGYEPSEEERGEG